MVLAKYIAIVLVVFSVSSIPILPEEAVMEFPLVVELEETPDEVTSHCGEILQGWKRPAHKQITRRDSIPPLLAGDLRSTIEHSGVLLI